MSAELVTIVTAFVDIGRGDWEGTKNDKPIPHYIKRDTETYLKTFEFMQNRLIKPSVSNFHSIPGGQ